MTSFPQVSNDAFISGSKWLCSRKSKRNSLQKYTVLPRATFHLHDNVAGVGVCVCVRDECFKIGFFNRVCSDAHAQLERSFKINDHFIRFAWQVSISVLFFLSVKRCVSSVGSLPQIKVLLLLLIVVP